ncbi:hypothetical protein [Lichenifustis flavocetrariae]|uniref:Uncharacterized protein n=1 Tax=Lichenifustis flavocetrariae TaxID=2949735 RepID=A0AA42CJS5_9HYPH|nr:hypothetical protein [Lichenifustis flavocetrariae]MCW6509858.1 hypothetical protein [Lichenifustis flavocetrariae]
MDIEDDALGRFGGVLREAFGARLHGVHDVDLDATGLLVAVVLVGAIAEGTRRLRIVDAVRRSAERPGRRRNGMGSARARGGA